MEAQKALTVRPAELTPDVCALLARAVQHASLADIVGQVESGAARVFEVVEGDALRMAFVLRVDDLAEGSEGVVVAAAGDGEGVNLTDTMLPVMEGMFRGCCRVRIHTARPGLMRRLVKRHGYAPREMVLTKEIHG